jgi:sugar/nucleoside kinase (ribokinase family)
VTLPGTPDGADTLYPEEGSDRLDVVAVGSSLVDVLATASSADLDRLGLEPGSMSLVDLDLARSINGELGETIEMSGGSAANTAAGLAALGARVGYIGKVADDNLGQIFSNGMLDAGVVLGTSGPPVIGDDLATGHCLVLVTEDGERTMATHLGVAGTLGPEDIDVDLVASAQIVYLEGYLWDLPPAKAALRRVVEVAHAADVLVALTVSDSFCVQRHRKDFLDLLQGDVDVLFANEEEALSLFGVRSFDLAASAVEDTGLLGVLTRGAAGSVVVLPSGSTPVPAAPVERVVDTTGAGDLFAAGFLYGLTHGLDPESSARLGGVCAAEIISHLGARPQEDLRVLAEAAGLR